MTLLSLAELRNCDPAKHYAASEGSLETHLKELALRAAINRNDDLEAILLDVAQEVNALCREHEEEVGRLESEVEEAETTREELEDALQEGLEYDQYQPILEAAREAGYKRRKEAKETVARLAG
jgi:hypothetical protein